VANPPQSSQGGPGLAKARRSCRHDPSQRIGKEQSKMKVSRAIFGSAVMALSIFSAIADTAAAGLPASVQADLLQEQLDKAFAGKNYKTALAVIESMKKGDGGLPSEIVYLEAVARVRLDDIFKGRDLILRYLRDPGKKGNHYKDALALYAEMQTRAGKAADRHLKKAERYLTEMQGDFSLLSKERLQKDYAYFISRIRQEGRQASVVFQIIDSHPFTMYFVIDFYISVYTDSKTFSELDNVFRWQTSEHEMNIGMIKNGMEIDLLQTGRNEFIEFETDQQKFRDYYAAIDASYFRPFSNGKNRIRYYSDRSNTIYIFAPSHRKQIIDHVQKAADYCRIFENIDE
jgi:hypothetical protein